MRPTNTPYCPQLSPERGRIWVFWGVIWSKYCPRERSKSEIFRAISMTKVMEKYCHELMGAYATALALLAVTPICGGLVAPLGGPLTPLTPLAGAPSAPAGAPAALPLPLHSSPRRSGASSIVFSWPSSMFVSRRLCSNY